jgi:alkylation response protein AidB-like acyl-CoA dehydrogenase
VVDLTDRRQDVAHLVRSRWGDLLTEIGGSVVERDLAGRPPPPELLTTMGTTGLLALSLPQRLGGADVDSLVWGMVLENIGYLCADSAVPLIINCKVDIARLLCESGRADLIERYAIPIADGRFGAGFAYTEGADAFSFRTVLHRKGDGYVLSGHKAYVTGGQMSDVLLTYPVDEAGDVVACLVERGDPGVTVTPADPVGMRTAGAASVIFNNVPLPADRILEATDGLTHAQRFLGSQRQWIPCGPVGRAQAVLEECAARASGTVRYGEFVAELNNVKASLGRMYVAVESARAMVYHALSRVVAGQVEPLFDPVVAAAKCFAVDQIRSVLERAQHVLGGHGFYGTPHLGRYVRDFSGLTLIAGTQDILEVNLGAGVVVAARERSA